VPDAGSLWRNRDFQLLWTGQAASALGSRASTVAYPLLVLTLTVALVSLSCESGGGMGVGVGAPTRWGGGTGAPPVFVGGPSY